MQFMQMRIVIMEFRWSLAGRRAASSWRTSNSPGRARPREGRHRWFVASMGCALAVLALASCGGDNRSTSDAAVELDAPPVVLDCTTYCREIQANCTGVNAQYADMAQCGAVCASFVVGGSVTDTSGNTLGCRIFYASAPQGMAAEAFCASAGPAGDQITAASPGFCSGGDVCANFCSLEIRACGSLQAPLPGDPTDASNNHLFKYQNMADCLDACLDFDKTHPYSSAAVGDSLACRLLQATRAVVSVMPDGAQYCAYTGDTAKGPCAGAPSP